MRTGTKYCIMAVSLFAFVGCIDKSSNNCDPPTLTFVKIEIDWGTISSQPEEMKAIFFPVDGSLPFSRYVASSGGVVQAPYGEYRVLLYNWTSDVQRIYFEHGDNFYTMNAYTDFRSMASFAQEALIQPDSLYAWSSGSDTFVFSPRTPRPNGSDTIMLQTRPASLVRQYDFFVPIEGLQYVRRAEAIISGAARDVYLCNGEVFGQGYPISVSLIRESGGVRCHFSAFGFVGGMSNIFDLRPTLVDGSTMDVEVDLTAEIATGKIRDFTTVVKVPYVGAGGGGFTDPRIEEWEGEYDVIPI